MQPAFRKRGREGCRGAGARLTEFKIITVWLNSRAYPFAVAGNRLRATARDEAADTGRG